jgi:HK97 family phage major capsid protein
MIGARPDANRHKSDSPVITGPKSYNALHKLNAADLDDGGFKSLGEFFMVYNSGRYDPRIQNLMMAASGKGISASGGVLVPEMFINDNLHPMPEDEVVFPRADVRAMEFETLHISGFKNLTETSGTMFGGFTAEWVAEHGEFTDQTPVTARITLQRKKLGLFTTASNELAAVSDFENNLIPAMRKALGEFRDYAFLQGDGLGKPLGVLNDVALITVTKETNQAASTIVYENLAKMYARLHPSHVRRAIWVVNPTTIPQLLQISVAIGTTGQFVPVLNQTSGSFSMFGLPVQLSAKLPTLGTAGDVLLADFSQYVIGTGRGIVVDRSDHYKFQNDQTVWRGVYRADGQGKWESVFTPRNGDTLSWCVKLGARA